jgi:hypothetical protein
MFLLGRVVVVVLGRVVGIILLGWIVRIILLGWIVRIILLVWVVGIMLRWVVRIIFLGRVMGIILLGWIVVLLGRVRITSGCNRGQDEEQGHQERHHRTSFHHCQTLSSTISIRTWGEVAVVNVC